MPGSTAGLTTRAAVLALVLCALVVSAALPLRGFLTQRGRIDALAQQNTAAGERVAALEQERARLEDPGYVSALARERLHFVRPGETAYILLGPDAVAAPAPTDGGDGPAGDPAPWYSQLRDSLQEADRPAPAPAPDR